MKKIFSLTAIILSAAILAVLVFTGCINSNQTGSTATKNFTVNSTNDGKKTEVPVEIKLSHWSMGYTKGFEQAVKKYNDSNGDDILLSLLKIPQYMYAETLNMLMASGEGPDIIGLNEELLNSYISRNWLIDLKKHIENDFLDKFPEWALNIAVDPVYAYKLYAVPSSMVTFRLIYNRDLFEGAGLDPESPPATITELKEYAARISKVYKGQRKYGFALPAGEDWAGFIQSMEGPASYSGIYYFNYTNGMFDLTVYEPWLQAFLDMKKNGGLFPGEGSLKCNSARMQFAEGNIGMMFATSWEPAVLSFQYSAICNWDVAMPPAVDEAAIGKGAVMTATGSCYAINSKTRHISDTVKVWKDLYSENFLGELYRTGTEVPIFKEIINNEAYKPDIENFEKVIPSAMDSPYPVPNGFDKWSRIKAYSSVITSDTPIPDALTEENRRLNSLFDIYIFLNKSSKDKYIIDNYNPLNPLDTLEDK